MSEAPDPLIATRFRIEIDGLAAHDFLEVFFPEAAIESGRELLTHLVLRRAANADRELADWWHGVAHGNPAARNLSVVVLDAHGKEQIRWKFAHARPVRYALSRLHAMEPAVLLETIELQVEVFERG